MTLPVPSPFSAETPTASIACRIRGLTITYRLEAGEFSAIRDLNTDIPEGKITALIGESGSGKTTLGLSLLNGVSQPGRVSCGTIEYAELGNILDKTGDELRKMRGKQVGMVFQAAQNSLNPLKKIGSIILDLARSHGYEDPRLLLRKAAELAQRMSLDPDRVLTSFQHELSGGMRQRVSIILALILEPKVLILDEPTTALDVLSQSTVLDIIRTIQRERQLTTILITHDMGVVAELADRVCVMYAGQIVEEGETSQILSHSHHPYTRSLIRAIPRLTGDRSLAKALSGAPPDLTAIPKQGCVFRNRCALRMEVCDVQQPERRVSVDGHLYHCHATEEVKA